MKSIQDGNLYLGPLQIIERILESEMKGVWGQGTGFAAVYKEVHNAVYFKNLLFRISHQIFTICVYIYLFNFYSGFWMADIHQSPSNFVWKQELFRFGQSESFDQSKKMNNDQEPI